MSKVNLAVVRAIIDNDLANLSGDTELVVRFTESVLARDSDTDELREAIRDQWADEGLIAIGYCISSCRVSPALKYTLGYGKACIRIKVNEQSVAPNRQAPLVMERNSV